MIRKTFWFFVAGFAGYLAGLDSVSACTICPGPRVEGLLLPTDDALDIAIATREAVVAGRLTDDPPDIPLAVMARWFARKHASIVADTLYILAVDTGEKCGIRWSGEGVVVFPYTDGTDPVLVTTRRSLHTIIVGELDIDEALRLNLARLSK